MTVIENLSPKVPVIGPFKVKDIIPITFTYNDMEDVKIEVDGVELVYDRDYEVREQSVVLKVEVDGKVPVTVYRDTPIDQQAEFPQNNKFDSSKINAALDKLCMQNQEQQEELGRSVKVPIEIKDFNGTLPVPIAGKTLRVTADGKGFEYSGYDPDVAVDVTKEQFEAAKAEAVKAATSATEAKASETTATTKANEASASATLAKKWATDTAVIENGLYSSKHYAEDAKATHNKALTDIAAAKKDATDTIAKDKSDADASLKKTLDDYLKQIKDQGTNSTGSVTAAGTSALNSIVQTTEVEKNNAVEDIRKASASIKAADTEAARVAIAGYQDTGVAAVKRAETDALQAVSERADAETEAALDEIDEERDKVLNSISVLQTTTEANVATMLENAKEELNNTKDELEEAFDIKSEATLAEAIGYTETCRQYADVATASARWGNISGNIVDQQDLKTTLATKGDGLVYEDGLLYLTSGGQIVSEGIQVSAGGGGGGGMVTSITLTNMLDKDELYVAAGNPAPVSFKYENSENLQATVQFRINNTVKYTTRINHGQTLTTDLAPYLDAGYNYVQVRVTDLNNATKSIIYVINTISLSISSTFDAQTIYTAPIPFRYTPVGDVEKTIHFELDGEEFYTETTTASNRQLSKVITMEHGVHNLRVWATAEVQGIAVQSNILAYEVMYAAGSSTLIASEFSRTDYVEGETVNIPLTIYNPRQLTTETKVYVNDELVSSLVATRAKFTWSKVMTVTGPVEIKVVAGDSTRIFNIVVEESDLKVEAVTENLELYLSAVGRNNNDANKTEWKYNNIACNLTGFNYVTNGWINNALKISNGARVEIPLKIFKNDFRTNGKVIEIEFATSNVQDFDSIVASCMSGNRGFQVSAQRAVFKSEQETIEARFKEDEHIRLGFVVEARSANRLIYTYLNGVISGIAQYPTDDDFSQINPVNIVLGSDTCDLDVYCIRVYDSALTHYNMLDNYIADRYDIAEKLKLYTANNIYDNYGNVLYNKILNQLPIMTFTGELPSAKGDKKKIIVEYENDADSTRNFRMENVTLDIQGTSSQYYPKKNYKISKLPEAYSLRPGAPAEKVFTLKADYMESSHAHNTGLARFINDLYTTKTPAQEENDKVRNTIDGFPIAIYYRATEDATPSYFGVYNFNNDKESPNVLGFTEGCESWEFANNTSARCLFLSKDFANEDDVLTDFEARYPADYDNYTYLQDLMTWVVDCQGNPAKFKAECEQHFNLDFLLTYYIISEFFGMVDSRAKNMFLSKYQDGKWYCHFYDMDTALGLNNEGVNDFDFNIEYHDTIGTENVFNGETSGLWNLVEQAYSAEIETLYNELRNSGRLTYDKVMSYLYNDQIAQICEAQYNSDADFKYISPLVEDGIATYLYTAQGSRADHMKWWLAGRFNYMDSKYTASAYKSDYMTLRLYTPTTWSEVAPSATINVTPYADQYVKIRYGSYDVATRAKHGELTPIVPPDITFNDTETILYGASQITSVGDLAPLYAGTIDVSYATKLTELKIGHGGSYQNTNLKNLTLGNNTLLQKLDIRNCPSLTGSLDMSGCTGIKEVKATGTSLTSIKLPEAGAVARLELPDTITNLTIKNQNNIEEFVCGNNISTLILENTNLDTKQLFESNPVTKVRLIGVDWTLEDFSILDYIYTLVGSDEQGNNVEHGVIAGKVRISNVKESICNEYRDRFVGLEFIVDNYADEDYIYTDFGEAITTDKGEALLYT